MHVHRVVSSFLLFEIYRVSVCCTRMIISFIVVAIFSFRERGSRYVFYLKGNAAEVVRRILRCEKTGNSVVTA